MTIYDARKICKDFSPKLENGKVRCIHAQKDNMMCWKPEHFLCELRLHEMLVKNCECFTVEDK